MLIGVTSNGRHCVSCHRSLGSIYGCVGWKCLPLRITGPLWGKSQVTDGFPSQWTSKAESVAKLTLHLCAWRPNERVGVSNHQHLDCLLCRLFIRTSKKTPKLRVTGLCEENLPWPVDSPHKGPVTRNMFPFDQVETDRRSMLITIMQTATLGWIPSSIQHGYEL